MVDKITNEVKWIKISTGLFEDEAIQIILDMPEGSMMLEIWLRLLILAGKVNDRGLVYLKKNEDVIIPYSSDFLATIFNKKNKQIDFSLKTFEKFGMIKILNSNEILISNWEKYQNYDQMEKIRNQNNERQKRFREKQKELLGKKTVPQIGQKSNVTCDVTVTACNGTDIEIDKEIDNTCNNISLSHDNSVTFSDERDDFYKFLKKKYKVENPEAYIVTLKKNGDYSRVVSEFGEQQKKNKNSDIKKNMAEDLVKVRDKYTAAIFIGRYGDYTDENHPQEVLNLMEQYGFENWTSVTEYSYKASRERENNG